MNFSDDTDEIDDDDLDYDEQEMRAEVLRRARTEGALVAYESAVEIAGDKKAPAVARASSQRTLLALAGLLDRRDRGDAENKPHSELSPAELAETLARLKRELGERTRKKQPGDVFS